MTVLLHSADRSARSPLRNQTPLSASAREADLDRELLRREH
ncbi:hypothetical protein [uncultured Amnibacterium sp.]